MVQTDSHQMGPATRDLQLCWSLGVWEQSPYLIRVPAQVRKQVTMGWRGTSLGARDAEKFWDCGRL